MNTQPTAPASNSRAVILLAFSALGVAACLNAVNSTLIVTAYPELAHAFDLPYAHVSALVMYYLAATAAAQPLAGALGDLFGRKRVFVLGIVGFCVGSIAAGFAETFAQLVVWRVVQAVFSGVMTANAASLVHRIVPEAKIATYLGLLSSAMLGASALAFPLGGLIVHSFDWPALFWCSVPIGALALVLVLLFVPGDHDSRVQLSSLSLIGLPFVPFALLLQSWIQGDPLLLPALLFLATAVLVFWAVARSPGSRGQFRRINTLDFNMGTLLALFAAAITFALMFMLPAWMTVSLQLAPAELGAYLSSYTFAMMIASPLCGRHIDRGSDILPRVLIALAALLGFALLLGFLNRASFVVAMLCIGAAVAAAQVISQRMSLLAAPHDVQALAMGIFNTNRIVGCMLGNALPALLLAAHPEVTAALGRQIIGWTFVAFALPTLLALWPLRPRGRAL